MNLKHCALSFLCLLTWSPQHDKERAFMFFHKLNARSRTLLPLMFLITLLQEL